MFANRKRIARLVVLLFAALTVVATLTAFWLDRQMQMQPVAGISTSYEELKANIKEHGITPDLGARLAALPRPKNWVATYLTDRQGAEFNVDTDRIVAANTAELVGKTQSEFIRQLDTGGRRRGVTGWRDTIVNAPGGKAYLLWTLYSHDTFWVELWSAVALASAGFACLGALAVWFINRSSRMAEPEQAVLTP